MNIQHHTNQDNPGLIYGMVQLFPGESKKRLHLMLIYIYLLFRVVCVKVLLAKGKLSYMGRLQYGQGP